jgi:hypothetical protein
MHDLPPSAFIHSAPYDPRPRRGQIYLTLGLAIAMGSSGIVGYSAGYAADSASAEPLPACRAAPPGSTPTPTSTPRPRRS